ncbi:MAG: VWA domain-containing protein [Phycisphaerae bacterium]|nr:VWA domain-containing protein [Phycisphaerae bacterium]
MLGASFPLDAIDALAAGSWTSPLADRWISFDHPAALLLIPLLGGLAVLPLLLRLRSRKPTGLAWLHTGLRLAVILFASVALADPQWTWTTNRLAVVLVRDMSASMPPSSQRAVESFIITAAMPDPNRHDRIGAVAFGANAVVVERPAETPLPTHSPVGVQPDGSNLAQAVLLGAALQAPDAGLRIVLASDGNETSGSILAAARDLKARAIPLDVIPLAADRDPWAMIRSFTVPPRSRGGSTIQAKVDVESTRPLVGELLIRATVPEGAATPDGELAFALPVEMDAGRETLAFSLPVPTSDGLSTVQRYDVRLNVQATTGDPLQVDPAGLRATALTLIDGAARVLVVRPDGVDCSPLLGAINDADLTSEELSPAGTPLTIEGWAAYDAVILVGIQVEDLGRVRPKQLRSYVEDCAGGLIVLGGPMGFARDWVDTPLEEALPVDLRLPEERMPSRGAVAIVLDRSGSMSAPVGLTGQSQQRLANESAVTALSSLTRVDFVSVIAFDGSPTAVVPLRPNDEPSVIAGRIRSIEPGGGTDAFLAIEAAAHELEKASVASRHIVLLTDGNTQGDPVAGVRRADELRRSGITLSTISIGDGAADALLQQLAQAGGGRYHRITSQALVQQLPKVLKHETELIRRAPIREGDRYEIAVVTSEGPMRGTAELPTITGYGVVMDRDRRAVVGARGPEGDPIVAFWNHGLGRVSVFTGDPFGRWADGWAAWPRTNAAAHDAFWRQMLRWTSRTPSHENGPVQATLAVEQSANSQGTGSRIVLSLRQQFTPVGDETGTTIGGKPVSNAVASVRFVTDDGTRGELALEPEGPGRFAAPLGLPPNAVALITARYAGSAGGETVTGIARTVVAHRGASEWDRPQADEALLLRAAREANGVTYDVHAPTSLFRRDGVTFPTWTRALWQLFTVIAGVLFLADVACRRLILTSRDRLVQRLAMPFVPAPAAHTSPEAPTTAATLSRELDERLARLQSAKRRAGDRHS